MGIDILGIDVLGIDILGIDIVALPPTTYVLIGSEIQKNFLGTHS